MGKYELMKSKLFILPLIGNQSVFSKFIKPESDLLRESPRRFKVLAFTLGLLFRMLRCFVVLSKLFYGDLTVWYIVQVKTGNDIYNDNSGFKKSYAYIINKYIMNTALIN